MNKFIRAIKDVNLVLVKDLIQNEPKWIEWCEDSGKNALHYLCGTDMSKNQLKASTGFKILKLLLKSRMDINSIHSIPDKCGFFPATPLWYAYTRGRNEKFFNYLLKLGADPQHCMFAIAWYDDIKAAALFQKHGAKIDDGGSGDTPFLSAFTWKRFNIAEWFLKNGADVNFANAKGNTALFYAIKKKYDIAYVQLLLKFGADINRDNKEGISSKKLAELNKQQKILKLFNAI